MLNFFKKKARNSLIHEYLISGQCISGIHQATERYFELLRTDSKIEIYKAIFDDEPPSEEWAEMELRGLPDDILEMVLIASIGAHIKEATHLLKNPIDWQPWIKDNSDVLPENLEDKATIRRSFVARIVDLKLAEQAKKISVNALISEILRLLDYYVYVNERDISPRNMWSDIDAFSI